MEPESWLGCCGPGSAAEFAFASLAFHRSKIIDAIIDDGIPTTIANSVAIIKAMTLRRVSHSIVRDMIGQNRYKACKMSPRVRPPPGFLGGSDPGVGLGATTLVPVVPACDVTACAVAAVGANDVGLPAGLAGGTSDPVGSGAGADVLDASGV